MERMVAAGTFQSTPNSYWEKVLIKLSFEPSAAEHLD